MGSIETKGGKQQEQKRKKKKIRDRKERQKEKNKVEKKILKEREKGSPRLYWRLLRGSAALPPHLCRYPIIFIEPVGEAYALYAQHTDGRTDGRLFSAPAV